MFGKKSAEAAPTRRNTQVDTLISQRTHLSGDITFSGGLHVDGSIHGNVIGNADDATLTLTERGRIEGDIRAPFVVINGELVGNVWASERLELAPKARVTGDVHYKLMEMQAGAHVNGSMRPISASAAIDQIKSLPAPEPSIDPALVA
jgi:cytoskeletal protein CcmA (bactofilin family)